MKKWALNLNLTGKSEEFIRLLRQNLGVVFENSAFVALQIRHFKDVSLASETFLLPDGNKTDFDFVIVKTDSSGNTVTITPFGTQLIDAASTLTLSSQGDSAVLAFDKASQTWWTI